MASQNLIAQIEERRSTELASANTSNTKTKADWEKETSLNSSYAMGFAGLGEIIKLFCLIFIGIYDQGLSKEAAVFGGSSTGATSTTATRKAPGYYHSAAAETPVSHTEAPAPTPRKPIYLLPRKAPEAPPADIVATCSYSDLSAKEVEVEAKLWLSHYRDAQSKKKAVESNPGYTEERRRESAAEHQAEINRAISRLKNMGLMPKKIRNVYKLVPVGEA